MSWKLSIAYIIIKLFGYSIQDSTPKILMDHMTHDVTLSLSTTEVNACDINTYIPLRGWIKEACWVIKKISLGDIKISLSGLVSDN